MRSPLTRQLNTLDIPISEEEYRAWLTSSALIQDVFPHLTASQREFIMTGYTENDWNTIFKDDEEDMGDDAP